MSTGGNANIFEKLVSTTSGSYRVETKLKFAILERLLAANQGF
jgi:hypothetical protein